MTPTTVTTPTSTVPIVKSNKKATSATKSKNGAWLKRFDRLVKFAKVNFQYEVKLGDYQDLADGRLKIIYINNTKKNAERMVYIMLHEMGHICLWRSFNYVNQFAAVQKARVTGNYGTLGYRMGTIEEEIGAWNEGRQLAKNLNLFIDAKRFDALKAKSINSYAVWATQRTFRLEAKKQKALALKEAQLLEEKKAKKLQQLASANSVTQVVDPAASLSSSN